MSTELCCHRTEKAQAGEVAGVLPLASLPPPPSVVITHRPSGGIGRIGVGALAWVSVVAPRSCGAGCCGEQVERRRAATVFGCKGSSKMLWLSGGIQGLSMLPGMMLAIVACCSWKSNSGQEVSRTRESKS